MKNLFLLLLFQISLLFSQDGKTNNTIYLEGFGVGGLYSINYERLFDNTYSIRIGFSTFSESSIRSEYYIAVPILGNYFLDLGDGGSKLELGLGIEFAKTNGYGFHFNQKIGSNIIGASCIGYRYQSYNGSILFRLGVSQLYDSFRILNIPGLSIGLCF